MLNRGWTVRAGLRNLSRATEVEAALRPHLSDPAAVARLRFVALDLAEDAGRPEALAGCAAPVHTASPFPMAMPADADALIRPAVDVTLRTLRAARGAGENRVVLTSSIVAVSHPGRSYGFFLNS